MEKGMVKDLEVQDEVLLTSSINILATFSLRSKIIE